MFDTLYEIGALRLPLNDLYNFIKRLDSTMQQTLTLVNKPQTKHQTSDYNSKVINEFTYVLEWSRQEDQHPEGACDRHCDN